MPVYGLTTWGYNDISRERSTMTVHAETLTDVNFVAQGALRDALHGAVSVLSLGLEITEQYGNRDQISNNVEPSASGQREIKIVFIYEDVVTKKLYNTEIPVADGDAYIVGGTDIIDLTDPDISAFRTAFEAYALSPYPALNAVSIKSGRVVGRNI